MGNLRLAFRHLLKSPFVTGVAIASLALGIGANAAIFSLIDQMLLKRLPVPEPGQLVNFKAPGPNPGSQSCSNIGDCREVFSYPMFLDLQREQTVFTDIALHVGFGANISAQGRTMSAEGLMVSGSYFPVLGIAPALGRLIGPDDDKVKGDGRVAVLAYEYWRGALGADPSVVGKTIIVNGQSLEVIGVAPREFQGTTLGLAPKIWVPVTLRETMNPGWTGFESRRSYWAYLFARLKPGVTIEQASASLNTQYSAIIQTVEVPLQQGMSDKTMAEFKAKQVVLVPGALGQSSARREVTTPLAMLFGITLLVVLIACANISNLLLARGAARSGEMAVRLALGGARRQLVSQLLTESLLLGVLGGLAGLGVAFLTLRGMSAIMPQQATSTFTPHLDLVVIGFTAALAILTAVLFGLFPALHATRPDLISSIREQGGQPSGGRAAARWRTALATAQIGLALALPASAGLFTRSLANISRLDLGVKVDSVITFGVSPELNGYAPGRSHQFFQRLEDELAATPGVANVAAAMVGLIAGNNWGNDVGVEGFPKGPDVDNNSRFNMVGPGYFATRRFDRPAPGKRLHMVSLSGAVEAPWRTPASYDLFLRATQAITRHADDLHAAFRRMVFNVLASNRDDHTRQHSYLMDPAGQWRLAPAYDLTYSAGPGGEHYLDVEGEGKSPTRDHVRALGRRHSLPDRLIHAIIDEVRAAVVEWPRFADEAGVSKASRAEIATAHQAVAERFST